MVDGTRAPPQAKGYKYVCRRDLDPPRHATRSEHSEAQDQATQLHYCQPSLLLPICTKLS